MNGTCAVCGPVEIRRKAGRKLSDGRIANKYVCATKQRAVDNAKNARRYGIKTENYQKDFDFFVEKQDGFCGICHEPIDSKPSPALDHDHETGRPRGVLCSWCNRGLGLFMDEPERLLAAVRYLTNS